MTLSTWFSKLRALRSTSGTTIPRRLHGSGVGFGCANVNSGGSVGGASCALIGWARGERALI